jgi:hypothetical protein
MTDRKVKKLSDLVRLEDVRPQYHKPDEYLKEELILTGYEFTKGPQGDYALMHVERENGEEVIISFSGTVVMATLQALDPDDLPVSFHFVKSGRQTLMHDEQ